MLRSLIIFVLIDQFNTRRERLKPALYLRFKKRKVSKICSGLLGFNQFYNTKKREGIGIRLEKHFFPTGYNKASTFGTKIGIFSFGKTPIVPKNLKGDLLTSQNAFFKPKTL